MMRVFAIGDVVGKTGVEFVRSVLPAFRRTEGVDFCVINGENAAVSNGITPDLCEDLFVSGADVGAIPGDGKGENYKSKVIRYLVIYDASGFTEEIRYCADAYNHFAADADGIPYRGGNQQ